MDPRAWPRAKSLLAAVADAAGGTPVFGKPVPLFAAPIADRIGPAYDVTPDGQRFLVNARPATAARSLHVVSNWTELLPRR